MKHTQEAELRRMMLDGLVRRMRGPDGGFDRQLLGFSGSDALEVLEQGILRALDGHDDPFELRPRGRPPALTFAQAIDAVMRVLCRPADESLEDAWGRVADELTAKGIVVSDSAIRDAWKDKRTRSIADFRLALPALHEEWQFRQGVLKLLGLLRDRRDYLERR